MSEHAIQIIARGPREEAHRALEIFDADLRFEGVAHSILEEDERTNVWRIDVFPNDSDQAELITQALKQIRTLTVQKNRLADANWLALALSGLPPVHEKRFVVFGAHDVERVPTNLICLQIDAGAAFGTGHHGTTAGCLFAFDRALQGRRFERVLDVGCGTGVLAIAAARTGSRRVLGVDIDANSVRISRENARLNRAKAAFVHGSGLRDRRVHAHAPYDLIFANILARPLVGMAQDIGRALRPGGVAILSGLLRSQERQVRAAYLNRGFRLHSRLYRDAWCTLTLVKR
jgi:ribosomal protein L11 methyltransferase